MNRNPQTGAAPTLRGPRQRAGLIRSQHASGGVTGAALRRLREDAGLSLEAAAAAADTTPSYLRKVEAGTLMPSRSYVARVTKALAGVPEVAQ